MKDYVPRVEAQLGPWFTNLDSKLGTHGPTVGLTPSEIAEASSKILAGKGALETKQAHKAECQAAIAAADASIVDAVTTIRSQARRMKTHAAYTREIGEDLGIVGAETPVDPNAVKPALTGEVFPGKVMIRFKKNGAQSVNIFCRKVGEVNWKLCSRDFNSPFEDDAPLATPNVPEAREYCARGMINDHEVGQLSDPVVVVFAG